MLIKYLKNQCKLAGNNEHWLRTGLAGLQNCDDRCVPPVLAGLGFNKENRARWGAGKTARKQAKTPLPVS